MKVGSLSKLRAFKLRHAKDRLGHALLPAVDSWQAAANTGKLWHSDAIIESLNSVTLINDCGSASKAKLRFTQLALTVTIKVSYEFKRVDHAQPRLRVKHKKLFFKLLKMESDEIIC